MALSEDQKAMLRLLAQREEGYGDIGALMGLEVEEVRTKVKEALDGLDHGLSQDQKAMLRLLAQREQGYDDIAALTGLGVEGVRAKVKEALAEIGDGAPPEPQAPAAPEPAAPEEKPTEPAPPPAPPTPKPKPAPVPPPKPAGPSSASPKPGLSEDKGALRALLAGGAVVLVIVLLLVTGVLGDGDDGSSDSTTATGAESGLSGEGATTAANGREPTEAVLEAVDGSNAGGRALFGRSGQNVVLLLGAEGLQQAPKGQSYTVSLVRNPSQRLPLVATVANAKGVISGRFQVAPQVLGLLAGGFDTMELSLVPDEDLRAALAQARTAKKAPNYGGTTVLEGPVTGPIVEAGDEG